MMKRILCMAAVLCMLAVSVSAEFTPGTYSGMTPNGRNGQLSVEVTLSEDRIESVVVTGHGETPFVSDKALELIPQRIVEDQSLRVDAVTGATLTSYAVMAAAKDAVSASGADVTELSKPKAKAETVPQQIEMDADLVIVGAGAAGCMMAVKAAELAPDAKIVLLEKTANIGGNAVVSGGYVGVYNPPADIACESSDGLTAMLLEQFKVEPTDEFSAYLLEKAKAEYEEYLKGDTQYIFLSPSLSLMFGYMDYPLRYNRALEEAINLKTDDVIMWFYNRGARFAKMLGVAGYSYPDSTFLEDYYSGAGFFTYYQDAIDEHDNLILMTETPATSLIMDGNRVTGVVAEAVNGDVYTIHASKGVALASGGYAADTKRVKETDTFWGDRLPERLLTDNISGTNSQAMDMAIAVGAATDELGFTQMFPFGNPKTGECHDLVGMDGILVNKAGKRTVDETSNRQILSTAIFAEENDVMWLISDANISWIADGLNMFGQDVETMIARGYLYRADTLEELAEMTGIDPEGLKATVEAYNAAAMGEAADETGRVVWDGPMTEAPYYAQPRTPVSHITFGGLMTDERMCVMNVDGEPIENLYAVGDCAVNGGGITEAMNGGYYLAEQLFE